jgi:hypothetical protein
MGQAAFIAFGDALREAESPSPGKSDQQSFVQGRNHPAYLARVVGAEEAVSYDDVASRFAREVDSKYPVDEGAHFHCFCETDPEIRFQLPADAIGILKQSLLHHRPVALLDCLLGLLSSELGI